MNTMDFANDLDKAVAKVELVPAAALMITEAQLIRDPELGMVVARDGEVIGRVVEGLLFAPREGVTLSQEDLLSIVELLEDASAQS